MKDTKKECFYFECFCKPNKYTPTGEKSIDQVRLFLEDRDGKLCEYLFLIYNISADGTVTINRFGKDAVTYPVHDTQDDWEPVENSYYGFVEGLDFPKGKLVEDAFLSKGKFSKNDLMFWINHIFPTLVKEYNFKY